jgi:UDP-N-acetylglucosamine 1-carboxyvinyltransferase
MLAVLGNSPSLLHNVPRIGTCTNLADLIARHGADREWVGNNSLKISPNKLDPSIVFDEKEFYYTSGAIHLIPVIASKNGKYTVPYPTERGNIGGDNIGSRQIKYVIEQMRNCGIESKRQGDKLVFKSVSNKPFKYEVPVRSYAASLNSLIAALFKKGVSKIINYTTDIEFKSVLKYLQKMGADIEIGKDILTVDGSSELKGAEFTNPSDRNGFGTWVALALASNSEIKITNVDYDAMGLEAMEEVIDEMGAELDYEDSTCIVRKHDWKLKPVNIFANRYPDFQTEWQVVFAPLLTQIDGVSTVTENIYDNRLQHYDQLAKMGAEFEYFKDPRVPENEGTPRAVRVKGPTPLRGAKLRANDLRGGACMVIAGLIAKGESEIFEIEHIFRGYENFVDRLKKIGADIEIVEK